MSFFLDGLKTAFVGVTQTEQQNAPETVEKLVDRVMSSTLLEDRRGACRALKVLSKKHRIEVGAQGMNALIHVLQTDAHDFEIVSYALDALCNITSPEMLDDEVQPNINHDLGRIGVEFTEIFIKQPDNVGLILTFLEEFDFKVRWPAVKLVTSLLLNKPKEIQEMILISPMAVSKLMDLLGDSREVIRNDVLLLLIQLTKGNANLQKIVAFENAFDRIFDVIDDEGGLDGGIVVKDSFLLMLNLLRNNTSNINFFKEGSYIQKLAPMCILPVDSEEGDNWSPQRVENIHCMLQVVRTLVTPSNPTQVTSSCQKLLKTSGLLEALCNMLMASGVPVDVLTETINTVAEVIRGNFSNQEYFSNVMAPSKPPRPAIVVLLMSMVNEKQPFILRCAVLYCFQCFLFKNEFGQSQLIQTFLLSSCEATSLTCGQLLCGGLFSADPISNWFSSVALSHGIIENPAEKEQLLKVLLSTSVGAAPVSLLHQCSLLLQQNNEIQSKLGLLMLLSVWLSHCPLAVAQFLSISSNIPFLTAQTGSTEHGDNEELVQGLCAFLMGICVHFNDNSVSSFSKENLCQIILKRIGLEMFLDKLGAVSKHEEYSKAFKHPQIKPAHHDELLLDHEFCRLFKALEGMVGKSVSPKMDFLNGAEVPDSVLVLQYKELIRDQDSKLQELERELEILRGNEKISLQRIEELQNAVTQLRDENVLLRAHANTTGIDIGQGFSEELTHWKNECERWKRECENISRMKNDQIQNLEKELLSFRNGDGNVSRQIEQQFGNLSLTNVEVDHLKEELAREKVRSEESERKLQRLEEAESELERLRKDQEDLLELLTDQDAKLNAFKEKLKALGEKVDDDEEDEVEFKS